MCSTAPSHGADDLTVDTTTVLNEITHPFLGVNYVAFWDSIQGSTASRNAMKNAGVELLRFPGGVPGDWYDWADPYADGWSSTSTMDLWNYAQGISTNVKLMLQTNPTTNHGNDPSGTHAADWVSYCKSNSIDAAYWEIGNEEDGNLINDWDWATYQWYIDIFNEQAAAMKARDTSIKVLGNVGMNAWYWWGRHSLEMFLDRCGDKNGSGLVDAVSLHWYPAPGSASWDDVRAAAQGWQGNYDYIRNCIQTYDTRDLPLFISECNGAVGPGGGGNITKTMACALANADMLGAFRDSGVQGVQLFGCIHNVDNNWGILYGSGESRSADSATPTYFIFPIWSKVGKTVVKVNGLTDPSNTLNAYAGKSGSDNAQVVIINKTGSSRQVNVSFTGFDPTNASVSIYELKPELATDVWDYDAYYNGNLTPDPTGSSLPAPSTDTCSGSTYSRTVPAYSVTMLAFVSGGGPPPPPPSAPTNLTAQAVSASQINLAWDDNSDNETGFKIERKTGAGGTWSQIDTAVADATSYQDTSASESTTYYYRVRAYNNGGNSTYSDEANATTPEAPQEPYGGTPVALPGRVQAEDYDTGGEGKAYHDSDAGNSGGAYRADDVDMENCSDTGGGYNVGWTAIDEWLEYTVNVDSSEKHDITVRVASQSGSSFHIDFSGTNKTGTRSVPNTGGWQNWQTVTVPAVDLNSGEQIMRMAMDGADFNVNWIEVAKSDADADKMPDLWEIAYFGNTGISAGGISEDWDNDGLRDLHEYLAGTDPTNASSVLTLTEMQKSSGSNLLIRWQGVTGKYYTVQRTTTMSGDFSETIASGIPGSDSINVHTVTVDQASGFYRIKLD